LESEQRQDEQGRCYRSGMGKLKAHGPDAACNNAQSGLRTFLGQREYM